MAKITGNYMGLNVSINLESNDTYYAKIYASKIPNAMDDDRFDVYTVLEAIFLANGLSISNYTPIYEHSVYSYVGNDYIRGESDVKNCLFGGLGNDVLMGADRFDLLVGDDSGEVGNDILKGGDGGDLIRGEDGHDKLYGEQGNDKIYGGYGDDILHGGFMDGSDTLDGGSDSLNPGMINQGIPLTLDKQKGETLIHKVTNQLNSEWFYRGDTVTYEDYESSPNANGATTTVIATAGVRIKLLDDSDTSSGMMRQMEHSNFPGGSLSGHVGAMDELYDIENLIGTTSYDDILIGNIHDNILEGLGGADELNGGDGSDTASYKSSQLGVVVELYADGTGIGTGGDAAGDILTSIENLIGSEHNDMLIGNIHDNIFIGLGGDDTFMGGGGRGSDTFVGGDGMDTVDFSGAAGAVSLTLGDSGSVGTGGIDNGGFFSLYGIENIKGTSAGDTITGNAEDNILEGGDSIDHLVGNAGNDELHGGDFGDVLSGGAGDDKYFFMYDEVGTDIIQGENGTTGSNEIIFDYSGETQAALMSLKFEFSRVDSMYQPSLSGVNLLVKATNATNMGGIISFITPSSFIIENYFAASRNGPGDFSIHLMYDGGAMEYGTVAAAVNMNFASIDAF